VGVAEPSSNSRPLILGASLGALGALALTPTWVPALVGTLTGDAPAAYWYLSRASGLTAYGLLWLSVVCGLPPPQATRRAKIETFVMTIFRMPHLLAYFWKFYHVFSACGSLGEQENLNRAERSRRRLSGSIGMVCGDHFVEITISRLTQNRMHYQTK
jgi:hypothetical protein